MDNLVTEFILAVENHQINTELGDYKKTNKAYNNIIKSLTKLKLNGELLRLKDLLNHENYSVQLWASTCLILEGDKDAENKLIEISLANIKHVSFAAKMTIKEWEKGNLVLNY